MAEGGHGVTPESFARSHAKARETFLLLAREFGDRVQVRIRENASGAQPREISLEELAAKPAYTEEQIREIIRKENPERGNRGQGEGNRRQDDGESRGGGAQVEAGEVAPASGSSLGDAATASPSLVGDGRENPAPAVTDTLGAFDACLGAFVRAVGASLPGVPDFIRV